MGIFGLNATIFLSQCILVGVTDRVLILAHRSCHHGSVVVVTVIVTDQRHACTARLHCTPTLHDHQPTY
jgi:hypothetical protein